MKTFLFPSHLQALNPEDGTCSQPETSPQARTLTARGLSSRLRRQGATGARDTKFKSWAQAARCRREKTSKLELRPLRHPECISRVGHLPFLLGWVLKKNVHSYK